MLLRRGLVVVLAFANNSKTTIAIESIPCFLGVSLSAFLVAVLSADLRAEVRQATHAVRQRWQIGMIIHSPGTCEGVTGTVPVPMDWPEQAVEIVAEDRSENVQPLQFRLLSGGVKQMVISIPTLSAGENAKVLVTLDVTRGNPLGAKESSRLQAPEQPGDTLRQFLGDTPAIETTHPDVRRLAAEITAGRPRDWEKAEAIYDWVRQHVKFVDGTQPESALSALRAGSGNAEGMTSLFIALCRVQGIPARTVWIPSSVYAEFYLERKDGQGFWFPCLLAGSRQFGALSVLSPILQKGDSFRIPGESTPKRYAAETLRVRNATKNPQVEFVRKMLPE